VIVLRDPPNDPSVAASETAPQLAKMRRMAALRSAADTSSSTSCPAIAETTKTPTINGVTMATIGIQPGERQLWRIVNASGQRHFDLAIPGVQLQLVAQDGVPLVDYAGATPTQSVSDVVIPPAGRAEVVVTGPSGAQPLVSNCYNAGPAGDPNPEIALGVLVNDGGVTATARVRKPLGLRMKLAYRVAPPPPTVQRTIHFQEDSSGTRFFINGAAYDPAGSPAYTVTAGTTEEWTVENDTDEVHAFHIHQVHFIVESTNGVPNPTPHWLDMVDVPPQAHGVQSYQITPSTVKLLIDFRHPVIRGTFLFHCHLTEHEDNGMMAKVAAQ